MTSRVASHPTQDMKRLVIGGATLLCGDLETTSAPSLGYIIKVGDGFAVSEPASLDCVTVPPGCNTEVVAIATGIRRMVNSRRASSDFTIRVCATSSNL